MRLNDPPSPSLDENAVAAALSSAAIPVVAPFTTVLLAGGYSWRTYEVVGADGASVVLRVAPPGGTLEPYDPIVEARAIEAARASVPAPRVLAVGRSAVPLGAPYLVETTAPGRVLRLSAVSDPAERERYRRTFARTLGVLHRDGDAGALGDATTVGAALRDELERVAQRYLRAARWARPAFEIGLRWLLTHRPEVADPPVCCHGDYRFGNLTWTSPGELGAVLDWERAWCGDPMADVAFTRVYSGWCAVDGTAVADYEWAGGAVDEARITYAARFEQVRSYTASMSGAQAFRDGRSHDPRLLTIGAAGEVGMLGLVEWMSDGDLAPLPSAWHGPAEPVEFPEHSPGAVRASVIALRRCRPPAAVADRLEAALRTDDDELAWRRAFTVLAPVAASGGPEIAPALAALNVASAMKVQTNG